MANRWLISAALVLSACAHPASTGRGAAAGAGERIARELGPGVEYLGIACAPQDVAPGQADAACLAARVRRAVPGPGNGGVQVAYVFQAKEAVEAWRAWSDPPRARRLGSWWAPVKPAGTRERYRQDYEICLSYNDLAHLVRCRIKPGTIFAAGEGQDVSAASCAGPDRYATSPRLQVYLYSAEAEVDQCTDWHVGASFEDLTPYAYQPPCDPRCGRCAAGPDGARSPRDGAAPRQGPAR